MLEIVKQKRSDKDNFKIAYSQKFLYIENISKIKKIKSEVELCIIATDFNKSDLKSIKKLKTLNENTLFWITSNNPSRENISAANKIGIQNIVSSPVDPKIVEEFFNNKNEAFLNNDSLNEYDCSCISGSKIMIIDDNPMNVELLKEILSSFGCEISTFIKPKEGYKKMLHEKFDLFLLDIMMPEMSGFEFAKRIKNSPINKNSPIVFISALSDSRNKIKGYDLGSIAYIEKPFDVNIIKAQIFNLLKNQKTQETINSDQENFLATIAHDLKTPINAEINALNLLLNENLGALEGEQQEIIEDILNSTKFMQDMVENILCKNKIHNNKILISKQVYSLKEIIEHCIELTKYILTPKQQRIRLQCDIENTFLPLDFLEIKRALHNLIANASEYSPVGGEIIIKIIKINNKIGFYIQDFGKGIDLEHQEDVFYQYISYAKKYKKVGTGLGLYITKAIVEAHDGEITLESKVDYGTKITVLLPLYSKE